MKTTSFFYCLILVFFLGTFSAVAQKNKKAELETRRLEITREIKQINAILSQNKNKQQSETSLIEDLDYKLKARRNLIKVTNQQANFLTREINSNQKEISGLRDDLKVLKDNYAKMIVKSYKSKNQQSRVMFLLSSQNFQQAYKRLQYMNQYTKYQKKQGEAIKGKTEALQKLNLDLLEQKKEKEKLLSDNKLAQKELKADLKQHETIMASIKKNLKKHTAQLRTKQREAKRIDRQIDKIIADAIAKSNNRPGVKPSNSGSFALTAEAKVLATNFLNNKGKLPWPVEKGVVKVRYGVQPSPIDRTLDIKSNGVRIATSKDEKVRAVFNGVVWRIITPKRANPIVLIKHGNYITTYQNLGKVYVKEGQKVTTKQKIGKVFTNPTTGESILKFRIDKDKKTQNPASWIYKM